MKPVDVAIAIAVQILWAVGFTLGKPVVEHFPPLLMMAMTYGVTALCLVRYIPSIATPFWRLFLIDSLHRADTGLSIFSGLKGLPASTAMLVLQVQAPFTVLFGWLLLGRASLASAARRHDISLLGVVVVAGAPEAASSWWPVLAGDRRRCLLVGGAGRRSRQGAGQRFQP